MSVLRHVMSWVVLEDVGLYNFAEGMKKWANQKACKLLSWRRQGTQVADLSWCIIIGYYKTRHA